MREPRNPFRLRSSEHIESEATFIRLFESTMLEVLPQEAIEGGVSILRSAPGGGKTSLMRLFSPRALSTLAVYSTFDECRELHQRLRDLRVYRDGLPCVVGVRLSCARNYSTLDDLPGAVLTKDRLLLGLLNARIALAAVRELLELVGLSFPADLDRLAIMQPDPGFEVAGLRFPCSGLDLFNWAGSVEARVCEGIDTIGNVNFAKLPGPDTLSVLHLLRPGGIQLDGEDLTGRFILMLDDVHLLTDRQREMLLGTLIALRAPLAIWIAERYEALSHFELLSHGATEGRDYRLIPLEGFWRSKQRRFERLLRKIADRRAQNASDVEIGSFDSCLVGSLEGPQWGKKTADVLRTVRKRVEDVHIQNPRYRAWVEARQQLDSSSYEQSVAWRALEILVERERRREQQTLDLTLPVEELEHKDDSDVRRAAELFLANEFGLPYYYGPEKLALTASSNIEQFLWLAGDQFEEIVSGRLIRRAQPLSPQRQEAILKRAVQSRLSDIPRRLPDGRAVQTLLQAVGQFCRSATYQPNAPYSPGVTGIGILMHDIEELSNRYPRLAAAVATAIADNLFEPLRDYSCMGKSWLVLNLNRMMCVHFRLPLGRGGWRQQKLSTLVTWLESGFSEPKTLF